MCTVSIKVDEATMQLINPGLTSSESIGDWLQHQVDLMMKEMIQGRAESRRQALKKDMTPEQLYSLISQEIDKRLPATPKICMKKNPEPKILRRRQIFKSLNFKSLNF